MLGGVRARRDLLIMLAEAAVVAARVRHGSSELGSSRAGIRTCAAVSNDFARSKSPCFILLIGS